MIDYQDKPRNYPVKMVYSLGEDTDGFFIYSSPFLNRRVKTENVRYKDIIRHNRDLSIMPLLCIREVDSEDEHQMIVSFLTDKWCR